VSPPVAPLHMISSTPGSRLRPCPAGTPVHSAQHVDREGAHESNHSIIHAPLLNTEGALQQAQHVLCSRGTVCLSVCPAARPSACCLWARSPSAPNRPVVVLDEHVLVCPLFPDLPASPPLCSPTAVVFTSVGPPASACPRACQPCLPVRSPAPPAVLSWQPWRTRRC
jgi:hypothetical protein